MWLFTCLPYSGKNENDKIPVSIHDFTSTGVHKSADVPGTALIYFSCTCLVCLVSSIFSLKEPLKTWYKNTGRFMKDKEIVRKLFLGNKIKITSTWSSDADLVHVEDRSESIVQQSFKFEGCQIVELGVLSEMLDRRGCGRYMEKYLSGMRPWDYSQWPSKVSLSGL